MLTEMSLKAMYSAPSCSSVWKLPTVSNPSGKVMEPPAGACSSSLPSSVLVEPSPMACTMATTISCATVTGLHAVRVTASAAAVSSASTR